MPELSRSFGRRAFGDDPATYDAIRPDYPEAYNNLGIALAARGRHNEAVATAASKGAPPSSALHSTWSQCG